MAKAHRFCIVTLAAATVTACSSTMPEGSEAYQEGWLQGCFEGYAAGGWKGYDYFIDRRRLAIDEEYRRGRGEALQTCYEEAIKRPARDIGPGGR